MVTSVVTKNIYSLIILFVLVVVAVDAKHGSNDFSAARRSFHGRQEQRRGIFTAVPPGNGGVNRAGEDPSSSDTTSLLPAISTSLSEKPSSASSEPASSQSSSKAESASTKPSASVPSNEPSNKPPPPSQSSASASQSCLLEVGGFCIGGVASPSKSDSASASNPAVTPSGSDSDSSPSASVPASGASASVPTITPAPSSSADGGLLGLSSILNELSSVLSGVPVDVSSILSGVSSELSALPSQVSSVVSGVTSEISALPSQVSSVVSGVVSGVTSEISALPSQVSSVVSGVTSEISALPSQVSSIVGNITSDGPSISLPVSITDGPSGSQSASDPGITNPPVSGNSTDVGGPSGSSGSVSITDSGSIVTDGPSSVSSSSSIIISLPVGNDTSSSSSPIFDNGPSVSVSIPSDLGFITTAISLAFDSVASTAPTTTLTDPDQATTTVPTSALAASIPLETAPLPSGLPNIIYPADSLDVTSSQGKQALQGYTVISILFNQELDWPFVVKNDLAIGQIMGWMPSIIATALSIPIDQVKTWALQVQIPNAYRGPSDAVLLGTLYRAYIPSDTVELLSNEIKAKQSAFYTGISNPVPQGLAQRVISGYSITGGSDPITDGGDGGAPGTRANDNSGAAAQSKSRQDAIIGVVSTVGAIALLVLAFLVIRSIQRKRELRHHRLSDPPEMANPAFLAGVRDEGRDFDQDSIGGQRRRSFYFAEDSLRDATQQVAAWQQQPYQSVPRTSPTPGMTQRRPMVNPGNIGPPVLQESSMNW